jgi:hypothetical protein
LSTAIGLTSLKSLEEISDFKINNFKNMEEEGFIEMGDDFVQITDEGLNEFHRLDDLLSEYTYR